MCNCYYTEKERDENSRTAIYLQGNDAASRVDQESKAKEVSNIKESAPSSITIPRNEKERKLVKLGTTGSTETFTTYKQKLMARKALGGTKTGVIRPETNGFYGDRQYWETYD